MWEKTSQCCFWCLGYQQSIQGKRLPGDQNSEKERAQSQKKRLEMMRARRQAAGWWGTLARHAPDGMFVFSVQRAPELCTGIPAAQTNLAGDLDGHQQGRERGKGHAAPCVRRERRHTCAPPAPAGRSASVASRSGSVRHRTKQKAAAAPWCFQRS